MEDEALEDDFGSILDAANQGKSVEQTNRCPLWRGAVYPC